MIDTRKQYSITRVIDNLIWNCRLPPKEIFSWELDRLKKEFLRYIEDQNEEFEGLYALEFRVVPLNFDSENDS